MTIRIDSARLRRERGKRAWTQEHLAEVSALGLRTIQRIEKNASASPESVQAIAACLNLKTTDLIVLPSERLITRFREAIRWSAMAATAVTFLLLILALPARFASAKEVALKLETVVFVENDRYEHSGETVLDDGEEFQYQMHGIFKVLVKPTILEDSRVLVSLKIFAFVDGEYVLTSEPALTTMHGREAVFDLGLEDDDDSRIRVSILPLIEAEEADPPDR